MDGAGCALVRSESAVNDSARVGRQNAGYVIVGIRAPRGPSPEAAQPPGGFAVGAVCRRMGCKQQVVQQHVEKQRAVRGWEIGQAPGWPS
jgi:hypothetical protein